MENGSRIGAYMAAGIGAGTALGVVFDNIGAGIAIGAGLGVALGLAADDLRNGKKDDDDQNQSG